GHPLEASTGTSNEVLRPLGAVIWRQRRYSHRCRVAVARAEGFDVMLPRAVTGYFVFVYRGDEWVRVSDVDLDFVHSRFSTAPGHCADLAHAGPASRGYGSMGHLFAGFGETQLLFAILHRKTARRGDVEAHLFHAVLHGEYGERQLER